MPNALSWNVEEPSKKFLDPDPGADRLPEFNGTSLYKGKFNEDPINSSYVKSLTDNKQTGKRRVLHNLLGGSRGLIKPPRSAFAVAY